MATRTILAADDRAVGDARRIGAGGRSWPSLLPGGASGTRVPASAARPGECPQGQPAGAALDLPAPAGPTLSEWFSVHPRDAGWTGLLAALAPSGPLLWVQERMAILEAGRLHPPGLRCELVHVEARDARAALWAMEEGLRCNALAAVVGELWGAPQALDFTATRRLAFAAETHGVPCFLVRLGAGAADLSGARLRWRMESAPSLANPFNPRAPGAPAWAAELFRARGIPPGRWVVSDERDADRLDLAAAPVDRTLGEDRARAQAG
ncbi:ImuA family protein [Sphingomicrobium nitratireducens]|uniref:ImuA family protein n=1 Tax=Sphingomicrobium nitratireducens TaxID=2964666 RepID=UPI00224039AC|nr:hypothetical protein [Sphingomicrobium nitratireducens]